MILPTNGQYGLQSDNRSAAITRLASFPPNSFLTPGLAFSNEIPSANYYGAKRTAQAFGIGKHEVVNVLSLIL